MPFAASKLGNIISSFIDQNVALEFIINGYSPGSGLAAPIATGVQGYLDVPFDCTLKSVRLYSDQTGNIAIDVQKATYANLFTLSSIVGSSPYELVAARKYRDTTLTGWTINFVAGDVLQYSVVSTNGVITRVTCSFTVRRSAFNQAAVTGNMHWRGTWDTTANYVVNDVVFYNGSSYIAIVNNIGDAPPGVSWELLASEGSPGIGTTPPVIAAESRIAALKAFRR